MDASDEYIASILKIEGKAGLILGLFFDTEDSACKFLRNVGWLSTTRCYIPAGARGSVVG
jgi:hypothetical protein